MQPPRDILAQRHLHDAAYVAGTGIADIWKVTRADGSFAALKIYKNRDPQDEAAGFALLQAANGAGCARVYHFAHGVAVMEWLDGASLADLARAGGDDAARDALISGARLMHAGFATCTLPCALPLPSLSDWFQALFHLKPHPALPAEVTRAFFDAKALAATLLDTQTDVQPLHGDFHHENLLEGPRGLCAFDAKGVVGERAFDASNIFLNPLRAPDLVRDPARATGVAQHWSAAFDVPARRVMQWAAARAALSVAWNCSDTILDPAQANTDLPAHFMQLADAM